jgi:hypothetical protein
MRARTLARLASLTLAATVLAAGLPFRAPTALACSCDNRNMKEVIDSVDAIVIGSVTSWIPTGPADETAFRPIELTLDVERVLKGSPPDPLTISEPRSYSEFPTGPQWAGSAGACGTFDADPTGVRAVYFLRGSSTFSAGRCSGTQFGIGVEQIDVDGYVGEVEAALSGKVLPDTGSGPSPNRWPLLAVVSLTAVGIAAIVAGAQLRSKTQ